MPAAGWLKQAVVDSGKPQFSLIDALKKRLADFQPGRSRNPLHASSLTTPNFCPKEEALLDLKDQQQEFDEFVGMSQRVTYDMGHRTADELITNWLQGIAVGNWRCKSCHQVAAMCHRPPETTVGANGESLSQHRHDWAFEEPRFFSQEYGVTCGIDSFFDLGPNKLMLTEIKTMATEDFNTLVCPLPEHELRTKIYLRICAESDFAQHINLHEARILYISRGHGKKNEAHGGKVMPFKEFVIKRDDEFIEPTMRKAKQLQIFRSVLYQPTIGGQKADSLHVMPSGICATAMDKPAKACTVCKECFSGQYPSKQPELP